ncbi:MAG: hypothetical protein ABW034_09690 [Steroidobacteraceae bacterium]
MNAFESFDVGDRVYCLAWIGKQFEIVARDDTRGILSLQGDLENVPQGAQVDIFRSTTWMVTHDKWDQIWYWKDRAGEGYTDVYQRFLAANTPGSVVTGYQVEGSNPLDAIACTPERAMAFRILAIHDLGIAIQPVVGLTAEGTPVRESTADATVRWIPTGPMTSAVLKMTDYRWSLGYGDIVLNWRDFV